MKIFKKNQIIIYVIALMLVSAGYLSYTTDYVDTSVDTEMQTADAKNIGDAQLVSSNNIEKETNTMQENAINDTNTTSNEMANSLTNANNAQNLTNTDASQVNSNVTEENTTEQNNSNEGQNGEKDGQNTVTTNANGSSNTEYFTTSKLERDTMYSQMIETYEKILNSSNALETQKQSATEEITKINNTKNSIMICENLIGTKGFTNNVIFVNGDSITAIIGATELKQEEVAQIQNIIAREMNASIENIHIAIK